MKVADEYSIYSSELFIVQKYSSYRKINSREVTP